MTARHNKDLQTISEQLLPVIAYGDATGLSVETLSRDTILAKYGHVSGLRDVCEHPAFKGEPGGVWSDDTQGSMAIMESLVQVRGFDINDQAARLLAHMDETPTSMRKGKLMPRGWGGSTVNSLMRIRAGWDPLTSGEQPGEGGGAGNGVLMKLSPLVLWQEAASVDASTRRQQVVESTQMTHAAPEALVGSLVHADVLTRLLREPQRLSYKRKQSLVQFALDRALSYEKIHDDRQVVSSHINRLVSGDQVTPEEIIAIAPRGGFYAPETLVMVYGSFLLHSAFPSSVYNVVELGGDTDTTAAIIAPMSLFDAGEAHLPPDAHKLDQQERLSRVSKQFVQLIAEATGSVRQDGIS